MLDAQSRQLHEETVLKARRYLAAEAELLKAIIEIDRHRLYEKLGETHLTPYCVKYLKLSEDVAGMFVRVARKSRQVPALAAAVDDGLQMSKARTIATVINPSNQEVWIEKAQSLTREKLEREVAAAHPSAPQPEEAKPVGPDRIRVEFEVSDADAALLSRARELLSQKENSWAGLGEAVMAAVRDWVDREDPVRRAERATNRQMKKASDSRICDSRQEKNKNKCVGSVGGDVEGSKNQTPAGEDQNSPPGGRRYENLNLGNLQSDPLDFEPKRNLPHVSKKSSKYVPSQSFFTRGEKDAPPKSHPPRGGARPANKRRPLPAKVLHQVYHRDGGACRALHADGSRCGSRRWIHLHHLKPKSEGGPDVVENLVTVCGAHHRMLHRSGQSLQFVRDSALSN